jgi:ParB family transcriptional regulator, chromosome partitioning protein
MSKSPFAGITSSAKRIDQPAVNNTSIHISLEEITDRPGGDTRSLNQAHVEALAESIAAVGLIQPIAVDIKGNLLAGGHRRAAIYHLSVFNPEAFNTYFSMGIPIRRYNFDASQDTEMALAIEATENEKRRDYTLEEVKDLAERLKLAGYNYTSGRPKKGQKSLIPSLSVIVGKSDKTIRRYLEDVPKVPQQKSGHVTGLLEASKSTAKSLHRLMEVSGIPDDVKELAEKLLNRLEKLK